MGSTPPAGTPPPLSAKAAARPISGNDQKSAAELSQLLELRDQEIQALKYELDKYKLALQQSQLNYHLMQQQLEKHQRLLAATGASSSSSSTIGIGNNQSQISSSTGQQLKQQQKQQQQQPLSTDIVDSSSAIVDAHTADDSGVIKDLGNDDLLVVSGRSSSVEPSTESAPKRMYAADGAPRTAKVLFKTGADDDSEEADSDTGGTNLRHSSNPNSNKNDDNLDELIQDVGEIDLNLELAAAASRKGQRAGSGGTIDEDENEDDDDDDDGDVDHDDDDEILSDQLLTSLTDAAISNLSQLAALQEQCESQQQHSHKYQQANHSSNRQQQSSRQHSSHSSSFSAGEQSSSVTPVSPQNIAGPMRLIDHHRHPANQPVDFSQDPFSSASISSQAAIAINHAAAAAAAAATACVTSSPMIVSSSCQQQQPTSSSSSVSPTSTIQTDLTTSHTLANVVVAAAAAAAAANDQHHQHQHSHMNPPHHQQSRLVSSALPSPDFYQSLHHHHQRQQQQQQLPYHQSQVQHHHSPLPALSSLHFSPSTSITPSPCSIMSTSQSTRRSTTSNASSSIVSPTASPNYLRRQFMPDRMPLMSPSPSSGLATGSSSGASSSLAHLLHHHQSQQRSASALGGVPLSSSSASGTPMSGTGSTAVSPLMSNKNSSQARLNNMQIRHKFGYLGSGKAQFNSPHGFCLGLNQEIVVADTNNHRVCIFDKSGTYITQFGSPGKEEGQLWNPRKVAILHRPTQQQQQAAGSASANQNNASSFNQRLKSSFSSGQSGASPDSSGQQLALTNSEPLYVVCDRGAERSRMQLFTKDGAFIKKIGIHYIDIVAGLAITQNGLIIVVDSVSPTVYIINGETGILNGWFDCSGYMKEPSDIAVKSDVPGNEYFICDFKGHCVVVFSEQGDYLRKIGHDGLTSYPNGIDISDDGDILVGDSHGNRFHVVVFDRNGNFVSQFECPHVKVSRCCGLKITREGYIVTLAKNNHHVLVLDTIHI